MLRLESPNRKAPNGIDTLSIAGNFVYVQGKKLAASEVKLQVGAGTTGHGSLEVALDQAVPSIKADLQFDALDSGGIKAFTAPFIADSQMVKAPVKVEGAAPLWSEEALPFDALKSVNVDVKVKAAKVRIGRVAFEKLSFLLTLQDGFLQAKIDEFEGYGGQAVAEFTVDSTTTPPTITLRETTQTLNLGQLLKDSDLYGKLQGEAAGSIAIATRGHNQKTLVEQLTGNAKLELKQANVLGMDLARFTELNAQNLDSLLNQQGASTAIDVASATIEAKNGVLSNNDLNVKMPLSTIKGVGTLALPTLMVDYRLTPEIGMQKAGLSVPVTITGDVRKPVILPDLAGFAIQKGVDQKLLENEKIQKITGKLEKVVPGALGKFLGTPSAPQAPATPPSPSAPPAPAQPQTPVQQ